MSEKHRFLLAQAALSYKKHEAGRQESFNVFSVLRSESDEVNLHSRFLHALLDHKKPGEEIRKNLADFLQHVDIKDFEHSDVEVERERYNTDILIINSVGQAVVIENKIWAADQPKQLIGYHQRLKGEGYVKIHLLYLTLDGHSPCEDSVGGLDCKNVSYKNDLPQWLKRCQQRACDEPGLRESVAQYLQLIRKLTGTDFKEAYMKELTGLCLQDDNLILVHELSEAMTYARVRLMRKLWDEIDSALKDAIPGLPPKHKDDENGPHSVSDQRIKRFITYQRKAFHGLFYSVGSGVASLGIEAGNGVGLIFGIHCPKDHEDERSKLEKALKDMRGKSSDWWIRYQGDDKNLKTPTRDSLTLLSSEVGRKEYAKKIAQRSKPFWEAVKVTGLD